MASKSYPEPSSSSSSSTPRWNYDVFLSFRGEDTRKNFTDHLFTALIRAGIRTFRDNNELTRGETISSQLLKAIEESRICILVFSKSYAFSTWCLDEATKIVECKNRIGGGGQIVLPIFYNVDPSVVRKQTGGFAEAFERHEQRFKEEMEKVNKWREALKEAANLSGWDLQNVADGYESKFIQKIVGDVLNKLNCKHLSVAAYPVGIDSRVKDVIALLNVGTDDVRIMGIYGMGGIGKTTIAKAVFNKLCNEFEGSSFLLNVAEISKQPNGLVQLQEQLLCDALGLENLKITNVDRGSHLVSERLRCKRVLLVLDDLDQLKQFNDLVGSRNSFGPGSRIIITSRDEHLLTYFGLDKKYHAEELNHDDSLQLFSWHALGSTGESWFRPKETHPIEDYVELSNSIVDYVGGVPLALEVLGSYLFQKSIPEWESAMEKLQKIPHHQIQRKLRISFDTLDDDMVKDIFLDIACFFIGMDKDYVGKILDGCGFCSKIGIDILIRRSLVTINYPNKIKMHDLLRDMGREIVREMSPKHPEKRSRLWFHDDALDVLEKNAGTDIVEGLLLDIQTSNDVVLKTESLARMRCLRLLHMNAVKITGCYEHLSKELRWLCWYKCPLKSLPSDFQLEKLVVLDMLYSNIREVWKEIRFLNKLKILNLSHSAYLAKTPNFVGLTSLEILILDGCTSLAEVHHSIRHLKNLIFLNLEGCKALKNLPESICYLKSLHTLNIAYCSRLEKLPEHLGDMEALTVLLADGTAIKQLPSSIGHLKNLQNLSLGGFKLPSASWYSRIFSWLSPRSMNYSKTWLPTSFAGLGSLRRLDLTYCGLSKDASIDLGSLSSLHELNFSRNKFINLPTGIGRLPKLEVLCLYNCTDLLSIPELPSSLQNLMVYHCTSLERLSIQSKNVPDLWLVNCPKLVEIQGLESVQNKPLIYLDDCNNMVNHFTQTNLQASFKGEHFDICLHGIKIPDWLNHQGDGPSISFSIPTVSDDEIQGLIVWVVCGASEIRIPLPYAIATIRNKINDLQLIRWSSFLPLYYSNPDFHSWVNYIPMRCLPSTKQGGEELELFVRITNGIIVKKCGVHLMVKQAEPEPDVMDRQGAVIPFTSQSSSLEDFNVIGIDKLDKVDAKRCREDDEAEPSGGCSKRLKIMEPYA